MKRILIIFTLLVFSFQSAFGFDFSSIKNSRDKLAVKRLLSAQVRYANRNNFNKFISTYDKDYLNSDGFDLDTYSQIVKELWNTKCGIKYSVNVEDVKIDGDRAEAVLKENSFAVLPSEKQLDGELRSESVENCYLKKVNGKWKVVYDNIIEETTYMLYGNARGLDIKLNVPQNINPNTEYIASLEFVPPSGTLAIASLTSELAEYPQKQSKEIFRPLPEDNILERFFTSNNLKRNEYIVASIGITQSEVNDLSVKLSLTGYGYTIKRVNVVSDGQKNEETKK